MNTRTLFLIGLALAPAVHAQSAFPERIVTTVAGVAIEADPADSQYVNILAARLQQPDPVSAADPQRFGIAELQARREAVLAHLAARLALHAPTKSMPEIFDNFSRSTGALYDAMSKGRPSHFTLWRKPDLVARLRAGQRIPGFSLEGNDVRVDLNASFEAPPGATMEELSATLSKAWGQLVWPVNIGVVSPEADIDSSLGALREFRQAVAGAESNAVMTVLHETVESTLISEFLHSPDRRWFCEGIANWLALEAIGTQIGEERAHPYYDIDALLADVGQVGLAELEKWPVAENPAARHYPQDLNQANYVRATWVIRELVRRHGPELIPKWMARIRETPPAKADLGTVYAAYHAVTGEDLARFLAAGQRPAN